MNWEKAKADPLANLIVQALLKQDTRTYHGNSGDMAGLALETAQAIRSTLSLEEK